MKNFKKENLETRKLIYEQAMTHHPNRIALIVEMHPRSSLAECQYFK